jgi:hypothetical protein
MRDTVGVTMVIRIAMVVCGRVEPVRRDSVSFIGMRLARVVMLSV